MTNGAVALLRKRWASLMAWAAAMDYSAADYTNDRIGGLEREVEQLKDELRRPAVLMGPITRASACIPSPQVRPDGTFIRRRSW